MPVKEKRMNKLPAKRISGACVNQNAIDKSSINQSDDKTIYFL